jgi:uncharacterized membrane protein
MRVEKDITVNAPVDRVYALWTDFENFPAFMKHVESVRRVGDNILHWKAKIGPVEKEWDAEIKGMVPNRSVTWHSTTGARNAGAVTLSQRGNITEVHVVIEYDPTWFEALGDAITRSMSRSVEEDLERFKRLAEGTDPQLADREAGPHKGQHGVQGTDLTYSRDWKEHPNPTRQDQGQA